MDKIKPEIEWFSSDIKEGRGDSDAGPKDGLRGQSQRCRQQGKRRLSNFKAGNFEFQTFHEEFKCHLPWKIVKNHFRTEK